MCIHFRDLNKVYPEDAYPLPQIDQLSEVTSRYKMLNFMDAYLGYLLEGLQRLLF